MSFSNLNFDHRRERIIEPAQLLAAYDLFHPTADQKYMLGCIYEQANGDRWRYCEDSGSGQSKATMVQASAPVANWTEVANASGTAAVAGDTELKVTLTTTACAIDDFREGFVVCMDVTAAVLGDMYLIKSNDAGGSGLTPTLQIADAGGIRTAIPITCELTVCKNKYKDVIVVPAATGSNTAIGVPFVDVTASYFFWAKTRGYAPLLIDTANLIAGEPVGNDVTNTNDAGSGGLTSGDDTDPIWGICVVEQTSGQRDQPCIIDLKLE